ncbi:UDP-D-xylose:L-fucose alpha-1,3-D-xylosyltransferase MGP4-like [Patiria miniata]|uniref:Nucleotide-diphospho-sugar transferase domain-containing protein n=1 Tax=Patiria miniata TaxID=46514 RepID=A0A913Z356_PATMI|nr:UDP-D-xylose:L-fucose alpha-1,3-D-xylosyltransferase MGP4-like [Patiria miniata]
MECSASHTNTVSRGTYGNISREIQDEQKPATIQGRVTAKISSTEGVTRGRLSNCSLADIRKRSGIMLLTTTNFAFLDMTLNMIESIKRAGLCVNTTVIAEDQKCHQYLKDRFKEEPGVHVIMTNSGETRSQLIPRYTREYFRFFNKRQSYILALLEKGLEVLFTDSDTFWFRDPFPYFQGDFDVSMMDSKSPYPTRTEKANFCAGFAYYKPTPVTIRFVKAWIRTIENNEKTGKIRQDQGVMNTLLRTDDPVHVRVQPLDIKVFPDGPKFYSLLAKMANYSPVVMHAATIRGHEAKIEKLKSSNMWLVNITTG